MQACIAIVVLFGAIQGLTICLYIFTKKTENRRATKNYILFLFSLSFFNLLYALLYLKIDEIGPLPLTSFPFPYKYLIGVGFYFYIKSQIVKEEKLISKYEYLLFLPAVFYGLLRSYWYIILHSGIDKDIFWNVYQSGFFIYNDYVYLTYNLVLMGLVVKFLRNNKTQIRGSNIIRKNWEWLLNFSNVFIGIISLNLLLVALSHLIKEYDGKIYSIILITNSIYIYWVGFVTLTKSNFLFNTFRLKPDYSANGGSSFLFVDKLDHYMEVEEVFTNKNLKVYDLATLVGTTEKELSLYIHESFEISFSEYINHQRIEKVKELLLLEDQKRFTLLAIAENAGFSSKSSFNAVFKKLTGLTPTQYRSASKI